MNRKIREHDSGTKARGVRPRSLRSRLLGWLGGLFLVSLLVLASVVYYSVFRVEQNSWRGRQTEATRHAVETVSDFVQHLADVLATVSLMSLDNLDTAPQVMTTVLQQHPALQEMVLLNAEGKVLVSAYQGAPLLANLFTIPQSTWFRRARAGELYLGNIEMSPAGDPYLIMAMPGPEGMVVAARLRMEVLWDVIAHLRFGETGQAYVVDEDGRIVAHTEPAVVLAKTSLAGRPELVLAAQSAGDEWYGTYVNFQGTPVVGARAAVPGTRWMVLTEISRAEAFVNSRMTGLRLVGVMMFFAIAILLSVAWLLERQVLRPLEQLRAGAERIGNGDLKHRIRLARQDEVGQVAAAFDQMADRLLRREAQLAAKTAALTAEVEERKRAEEALHRSEELFRAISEQMPDSLLLLSLDDPQVPGKIIYANQAVSRMHGYPLEEIIGRSISFLDDPASAKHVPERIKRILNGETLVFEAHHCRKDGSVFPVEVTARLIDYGDRKVILALDRDITERKRAEEALQTYAARLRERNRELQDLVYVASHDLQEPLRKVQTFTDWLRARYGDTLDAQGRYYLQRTQQAAARMQALVEGLLAYLQVTTRTQTFGAVDLDRLVRRVLADLEMQIEQTGARVEVGDLPTVEADPVQMRQLFHHLISNALKFRRKDETPLVQVRAQPLNGRDGVYQISVTDNGIGFEQKYADRIFHAFERLHGWNEYEGTGIGLTICRKIVERHGGSIAAQSAPGQGATFVVTLPLKQSRGRE
ncbi:MAG: PAS domain S-box protein [Anaerolineae bacterium]|nr:PAS domain S-box protein [Anaerolineae bacterium]